MRNQRTRSGRVVSLYRSRAGFVPDGIADKRITSDEYHAAFERYRACLQRAGFEIVMGTQIDDTLDYSIPAEAVDSGVDEPCYSSEFVKVDSMWQLAHVDTSESSRMIRECVGARGLPTHASNADNEKELKDAGIPMIECAG